MDEKRKELQGFTIDRINELCGDKYINKLIERLLGAGPEKAEAGMANGLPTSTHLMEMAMQMQQDQRAWLELLDAVLTVSRASEESRELKREGQIPKAYIAETFKGG